MSIRPVKIFIRPNIVFYMMKMKTKFALTSLEHQNVISLLLRMHIRDELHDQCQRKIQSRP